jgi:hypothetical protein
LHLTPTPNEKDTTMTTTHLTFGLLAGVYKDQSLKSTLTHLCEVDSDGQPTKLMCKGVKSIDSICPDGYTATQLAERPTCKTCGGKFDKLHAAPKPVAPKGVRGAKKLLAGRNDARLAQDIAATPKGAKEVSQEVVDAGLKAAEAVKAENAAKPTVLTETAANKKRRETNRILKAQEIAHNAQIAPLPPEVVKAQRDAQVKLERAKDEAAARGIVYTDVRTERETIANVENLPAYTDKEILAKEAKALSPAQHRVLLAAPEVICTNVIADLMAARALARKGLAVFTEVKGSKEWAFQLTPLGKAIRG